MDIISCCLEAIIVSGSLSYVVILFFIGLMKRNNIITILGIFDQKAYF